jgi:hypothetical protein
MPSARTLPTLCSVIHSGHRVPRSCADVIRIVLAAVSDQQRSLVEACLEQANSAAGMDAGQPVFLFASLEGRGLTIIQRAADADVVLLGLQDEVLPGEASHLLAAYPTVKIIGVDGRGLARVVLGAIQEPLSRDLPTVIRWITRRGEATD